MRWSIKPKSGPRPYEPFIIEKFALFPICINNECRWLERVKIQAHYWVGGISGARYREYDKFVDD